MCFFPYVFNNFIIHIRICLRSKMVFLRKIPVKSLVRNKNLGISRKVNIICISKHTEM